MDELISSRASSVSQPAGTPANTDAAQGQVSSVSPLPEGPVPIGSLVFADELPDGVVVADETGRVAVFNADGSHRSDVTAPLPMVTSLCFGGEDLHDLFVVTGSEGGPKENCGSIFRTRVEVAGLPLPQARVAI